VHVEVDAEVVEDKEITELVVEKEPEEVEDKEIVRP